MKIFIILCAALLLCVAQSFAGHSIIVEMEGTAAVEEGQSEQETCRAAILDAKRNATEQALSLIKSETVVKNFQTEKDLVTGYSLAKVSVIGDLLLKEWFTDPVQGKSCRVKAKMEVTPVVEGEGTGGDSALDNPTGPLVVKVWTDKDKYREGEKVTVYVRGNKPCYVKLVYRDAEGNLLQLLPNPYRKNNYFNGGTIYTVPSGNDQFELEVTPPFGSEKLMLYASTAPLGDVSLTSAESVYQVNESEKSLGLKTRGIKIRKKGSKKSQAGKQDKAAEFYETSKDIEILL